jgi:MFS family permease
MSFEHASEEIPNQPIHGDKKSKKTLFVFSASSFLNDLGSDMLQPIWPIFVTKVIGADAAFLGLIDGIGNAAVYFSQFASGYISDAIKKRKIFIWAGYFFAAIGKLGYFISTVPLLLVPSKILDRMGKMRDAPRDAIITEIFPAKERGEAFGFIRAFDRAGAVLGILASLYLLHIAFPIRSIIFISVIPSILAALLILFFIKERNTTTPVKKLALPSFKSFDKNFLLYLTSLGLIGTSTFSFSFLLLGAGELGYKETSLPILYLLFTSVAAITSYSFGKLGDKRGSKNILTVSYLLWIGTALCFILPWANLLVPFTFILYGLFIGAYEPISRAIIGNITKEEHRATALGTTSFITGIVSLPSSLIAGILWQAFGFKTSFIFSIVIAIIALAILRFVKTDSE